MQRTRPNSCRFRIALAAALALACPAAAEEIQVALVADGEYNTNVTGRQTNEIDSFLTHIGPIVTVKDPYGRFTYDARYRGDFTWYENGSDGLNGWEQYLDAEMNYAISQRTSVTIEDSFRDVSSIRFSIDEQDDFTDTLDGARDQFDRNVFASTLEHMFTRRLFGQVRIDHEFVDFDDNRNNTDSTFMGATGSLSYALSSRDRVGAGGGFTYQIFEATGGQPDTRGQVWNSFLSWVHVFESDMKFSIQGGPSWIKTISPDKIHTTQFLSIPSGTPGIGIGRQDPCSVSSTQVPGAFLESSCALTTVVGSNPRVTLPFVGADPTSTDVTFFGSASLVRRWEAWEFRASYVRRQSGASGDNTTSALDRALLSVNYDADRLWSFYGSVGWSRRERLTQGRAIPSDFIVTASPGSGPARRIGVSTRVAARRESRIDQYNVIIGSRRRLTKHLNVDASFRYRYALRDRTVAARRRAEFYIAGIALQYYFDPVRF